MRLELRWESGDGRHTDCLVAPSVNLWRDILPPELERQIMDGPLGHRASHRFSPGELLEPASERNLFELPRGRFNRQFTRRGLTEPRAGRFYPRGILQGVDGIFRMDRHPFRVAEAGPDWLLVDLNHPLADRHLELTVSVEDIWGLPEERGGSCNEIAVMVSGDGPGMQARWQGRPTDFWSDLPYLRTDPGPDTAFYARPRFVDHLDSTAIAQVRGLYGRLIPDGSRALDLMSSWHSHLPETVAAGPVTGLGLNREELAANPALDEHLVQDLNRDPVLPFADAAFDAVVCTVSVEYLTRPLEVFREVARVLRPGGRFVVTFSNRWFPPKVIRVWEGIHEFERPGLVSEYFLESRLFEHLETWSMRGLTRPEDDKYAGQMPFSDPVYAVWADRSGG
jgi:SAM-dependent methyltransferase